MKDIVVLTALVLLVAQITCAQDNWSHVGPKSDNQNNGNGFETSRLEDITFDPNNPNHLFASGLLAGLWQSNNGGNNWIPIDITTIHSGGVADVAFWSANEILVANSHSMGKGIDDGIHHDFSTGIWRYDFMLQSWQPLNPFGTNLPPYHIRTVAVNNGNIYACTSIGLFVSFDAGQSWLWTETGFVENIVFVKGPGIPDYYCYIAGSNTPGQYGQPTGKLMVKESQDEGVTFSDLSANLSTPDDVSHSILCTGPNIGGNVRLFLYTIAKKTTGTTTTEQNYIQTFTKNVPGNSILNTSFQKLNSGSPAGGNGYVPDRVTIEYDPINDGVWYGGTRLVFKDVTPATLNNTAGISFWQDLHSRTGIHDDIHDIKLLPNTNKMYIASDGGLSEMVLNPPASQGATPSVVFSPKNQGLHVCLINGFSGTDKDPNLYVIGAQDIINSDVYDAGLGKNLYTHQTWENDGALIDKFDKRRMFFDNSSYDAIYHTSEDGGQTLVRNKQFYVPKANHPSFEPDLSNAGVNTYPTLGFTSRLFFQDPYRPDRIFFVKQRRGISQYYPNTGDPSPQKQGVFTRKIDFNSPLLGSFGIHGWISAVAMSFSPQTINSLHFAVNGFHDNVNVSRPSIIKYVGNDIKDCWEGHNHDTYTLSGNTYPQWTSLTGNLWENAFNWNICKSQISTNGPGADMYGIQIKEIETSAWNKDLIYVMLMVPHHPDIKVWKYDGAVWTNYGQGIPDEEYVYSMIMDYQSNDGLYLSTDMGVYYRDASMSAWKPFRKNLPLLFSKQMELNYSENTVRVGTFGQGIWKSNLNCPTAPYVCSNCNTANGFFWEGTHVSVSNTTLNTSKVVMRGTDYVELLPGSGFTLLSPSNSPNHYYQLYIHGCGPGQGNTFKVQIFNSEAPPALAETEERSSGQAEGIRVFPNPNNGIFTLETPSDTEKDILLFDAMGKLVFQKRKTRDTVHQIDLGAYPKGVYLVQVSDGAGRVVKRVVTQ